MGDQVFPREVITSSVYWSLVDDDTLRIWKQAGANKSRRARGDLGGTVGEVETNDYHDDGHNNFADDAAPITSVHNESLGGCCAQSRACTASSD